MFVYFLTTVCLLFDSYLFISISCFTLDGVSLTLKMIISFSITVIERNLPWFIISKTLSKEQGLDVKTLAAQLCAELGPQALAICNSFAITDTMLSAPIALDWVKYNSYDNQGELMSREEWDRTVMNKK